MKRKDRAVIKKENKESFSHRIHGVCMGISIIAAAALTVWACLERGLLVEARADAAMQELSGQVLRFHVLADSDGYRDQQTKMQVKERVLSYLQEEMKEEETLADTEQFVRGHLEEIADVARQTVREEGSSDSVTAELVTDEFPRKTYGDVTFPAGTYEALRIRIGSGSGRNWWCCLYPDLCFTDAVHAKVVPEDKQELRGVLDEDAYEMITCTSDFKIKWFFFQED